jgi:hypothetical protein
MEGQGLTQGLSILGLVPLAEARLFAPQPVSSASALAEPLKQPSGSASGIRRFAIVRVAAPLFLPAPAAA